MFILSSPVEEGAKMKVEGKCDWEAKQKTTPPLQEAPILKSDVRFLNGIFLFIYGDSNIFN